MTAPSVIPSEVDGIPVRKLEYFREILRFRRAPLTMTVQPMNFKLKIWRQRDAKSRGKSIDYEVRDISPETSFLEMLDILNENLIRNGGEPVAFDSDCREGICGTCSLTVNGEAHGQIIRALCASFTCESFATARP